MITPRKDRPPISPNPTNPNHRPDYDRLDAAQIARDRNRHPLDSDDPQVRWQYLVDHRLIGNSPPQAPEHADNIRRWEEVLGLRPPARATASPRGDYGPRVVVAPDPRLAPENAA